MYGGGSPLLEHFRDQIIYPSIFIAVETNTPGKIFAYVTSTSRASDYEIGTFFEWDSPRSGADSTMAQLQSLTLQE